LKDDGNAAERFAIVFYGACDLTQFGLVARGAPELKERR
jgi:hypothetical protein